MVTFVVYATRPELFAQEIDHINSLLFMHNTRSVIVNDRTRLVCLASHLGKENSVVLLFASSAEELEDLVHMKEHFGALPTILVLPDDNTKTLQKGMLLHPLFFMAKHAEFSQFSLAINELCSIHDERHHQRNHSSLFNTVSGAVS